MPIDLSRASAAKQMRDTWQSTSAALVRRYQRAFAKAADFQPLQRLDGVDSQRDRFLNDVGTRADELHSQLLRAMRDHATSGDTRQLARLCEVAIELQDIRSDHRQAVNDERLHMLTTGQEVSARLSPTAGVKTLLERAATTICDLPGLERAMVFQRDGGVLRAAAAFYGTCGARVIHQNVAHHIRRDGEKVRPVLPTNAVHLNQPEEHFVNQGCGLQRVAYALLVHVDARHPAQFHIHLRRQCIERLVIASPPGFQKLGDSGRLFTHEPHQWQIIPVC